MAMSSKIDELPGSEQEIRIEETRNSVNEFSISDKESQNNSDNRNIKMNVKKKVRFEDEDAMSDYSDHDETGIVSSIKNEINEENLLILGLLFISSSDYINKYIYKLPVLGAKIVGNKLFFSLTKAVLIFLIFVFVKKLLLPRIKV